MREAGAPVQRQIPVHNIPASTGSQRLQIAMHPAFRIGFLDSLYGRPFDHDNIMRRIVNETPPNSLKRIRYNTGDHEQRLFDDSILRQRVVLAQYRYEEGRLFQRVFAAKCKAWGHPDYPPAIVRELCETWPL